MPGKSLKSMGPVVGIESGLEYARNLFSMVIAFDMPFISYNLLYLLEEIWNSRHGKKDAFIIKTEKGFEALCGIYSKNCLDSVKDHIEKGVYKISEVFHNPGTEFILLNRQGIRAGSNNIDFYKLNDRIIDNLNFFNINTADDYDFFIKIWDFKISLFQESLNQYGRGSSICEDKYHCEKWKYFFYRN
jgi:molybdopterin-guanine dinucleotide biosynthesis protein A